jgi:hypothetical protein
VIVPVRSPWLLTEQRRLSPCWRLATVDQQSFTTLSTFQVVLLLLVPSMPPRRPPFNCAIRRLFLCFRFWRHC